MSEQPNTTSSGDGSGAPTGTSSTDTGVPVPQPPKEQPDKLDDDRYKEAARYRKQLRAEEAARAADAEQHKTDLAARDARIEKYQRAEVERLAAGKLSVPGDLFEIGQVEVSDLLDESGEVDEDAVAMRVDALLEARPRLGVPAPRVGPSQQGMGAGSHTGQGDGGPSWAEFLHSGD